MRLEKQLGIFVFIHSLGLTHSIEGLNRMAKGPSFHPNSLLRATGKYLKASNTAQLKETFQGLQLLGSDFKGLKKKKKACFQTWHLFKGFYVIQSFRVFWAPYQLTFKDWGRCLAQICRSLFGTCSHWGEQQFSIIEYLRTANELDLFQVIYSG